MYLQKDVTSNYIIKTIIKATNLKSKLLEVKGYILKDLATISKAEMS